jgi:molybdenum cofactor cytidylyltransferase
LFRREVFPELLALTGDEGGRQVVRKDPARVARVLLPAEAAPPDLDTPEDYERYLERMII